MGRTDARPARRRGTASLAAHDRRASDQCRAPRPSPPGQARDRQWFGETSYDWPRTACRAHTVHQQQRNWRSRRRLPWRHATRCLPCVPSPNRHKYGRRADSGSQPAQYTCMWVPAIYHNLARTLRVQCALSLRDHPRVYADRLPGRLSGRLVFLFFPHCAVCLFRILPGRQCISS